MTSAIKKVIAVILLILLFFFIFGVIPAAIGLGPGGVIPALIFFGLAGFIWKKMTKKEEDDDNKKDNDSLQSDYRLDSRTDLRKDFIQTPETPHNDDDQSVNTDNNQKTHTENIEPIIKATEELPSKKLNVNSLDDIAKLMKRGHIFLEATEWQKAKDIFNEILEIDPENAYAYIGLLCADLKVTNEMYLTNKKVLLEIQPNFIIATRFADVEYRKKLNDLAYRNQFFMNDINIKNKKRLKIFILLPIVICIFLFFLRFPGCFGWGILTPSDDKTSPGIITNWSVRDNQLSIVTKDSTYVQLSYVNWTNPTDTYQGWTAGEAVVNHTYFLPVDFEIATRYEMKLSVFNKNDTSIYQDTTFIFSSTPTSFSHLKVHFLNVQQGDAILIQSPDGQNMMIDGGYGRRGTRDWQGGGVPIALNYLIENNVTYLDYIIESHRHLDHWGGLDDIENSGFITTGQYISNSQTQGYQRGSRLMLGSDVRIDFYNIGFPPNYSGNNINNTSIVLKATHGDVRFLFAGDIYGEVQTNMYSEGFDLSVNVLKVPNHGASSNGSSDERFLIETLGDTFAQIAILSFGLNNTYNHPREMQRFKDFFTYGTNEARDKHTAGSKYSDDCGHIVVYSDGKMVFVWTER